MNITEILSAKVKQAVNALFKDKHDESKTGDGEDETKECLFNSNDLQPKFDVPTWKDFIGEDFMGKDISGIDFSEAKGLNAEQLFKAEKISRIKLPEGLDCSKADFTGKDISGIDFSKAKGLNAEQLFRAEKISRIKLPEGLDCSKVDFTGKDISGIDFSEAKGLNAEQLFKAEKISRIKLPEGLDCSMVDLTVRDVSDVDFSAAIWYKNSADSISFTVGRSLNKDGDEMEAIDADSGVDLESRALLALNEQQALCEGLSVSYLQDRLGLGYGRAARIFEEFEDRGLLETDASGKKILAIKINDGDFDKKFTFVFDNKYFNALIGGISGSGKTVLLHAIICEMIQMYPPADVRLILMDYKEGVEFSVYKDIPHLYAMSLGSHAKFGSDVLNKIGEEIESRGTLFRDAGVKDFSTYNADASVEKLPRIIIVIDEFQRLLKDENYGDSAKANLEDIIRRGRAFGINLILSTQTLMDFPLTQATLQQIPIRICLKLSEDDSSRFLCDKNLVPAGFDEVGLALFNDNFGALEDNQLFKAEYYSEEKIESILSRVKTHAGSGNYKMLERYIYVDERPIELKSISDKIEENRIALLFEMGIPPIITKIKAGRQSKLLVVGSESEEKRLSAYIGMLKTQYKKNGYDIVSIEADDAAFCKMSDKNTAYFIEVTDDCDYKGMNMRYFESKEDIRADMIFYTNDLSISKKINDLDRDLTYKIFMGSKSMKSFDIYSKNPIMQDSVILYDGAEVKTGLLIKQ